MSRVTVTRDMLDKIMASLAAMGGKRVLIGIPAPENGRNDGAIGNAALGYVHERGSGVRNIPARPFLVPGVQAAEPLTLKTLKVTAQQMLTGKSEAIDRGLNAAGLIAQSSVKRTLKAGEGFAPLAPATLAARRRKGFRGESPLIRTGQLLNSITYVVRER